MTAKIFVSCGQQDPKKESDAPERETTEKIKSLLSRIGFENKNIYLAFEVQSLNGVMGLIDELRDSDYYIFIDFCREVKGENKLPISIFTHQELAIAHLLEFDKILAFRQEGCPEEGFSSHIQLNPLPFDTHDDLIDKLEKKLGELKWDLNYSRNLVCAPIEDPTGPFYYTDHQGTHFEYIWKAKIENRRTDQAAVNTVCILTEIKKLKAQQIDHGTERPRTGEDVPLGDKTYLKWAGTIGYTHTILPLETAEVDMFSVRIGDKGIYLHSESDESPKKPILEKAGEYELTYKVFSDSFPLTEFKFVINLPEIFEKLEWGETDQKNYIKSGNS